MSLSKKAVLVFLFFVMLNSTLAADDVISQEKLHDLEKEIINNSNDDSLKKMLPAAMDIAQAQLFKNLHTILNQSLDHKDTKAMSIELKKMLALADEILLTAKGREKKAIAYLRKSLVKLLKKKTYKESSLKKIFSKKTAGKFTKFTEAYDADTIEKNIRQKIWHHLHQGYQ